MLRELLRSDRLSPATLWSELPPETRRLAAEALYGEADGRREADTAIASALRFRPAAVRRLPLEQRVRYLLRSVFPDDALAGSLLLALHLTHRRSLLATFLTRLEIPHQDGVIDTEADFAAPDAERLVRAVEALYRDFAGAEVEVYLMSLLALDPDVWGGLQPLLEQRPDPA